MITEAHPGDHLASIRLHLVDVVNLAWKSGVQLPELSKALQREFISRGLQESRGDQQVLAAMMGTHRNTLARAIARVGVTVPKRRARCAPRK